MYETILYQVAGGVATVTLNRPASLNSINFQMIKDLNKAFGNAKDDQAIRCVVLTGAGRGFCSGADLTSGMLNNPEELASGLKETLNPLIKSLHEMEKPVIAAVNGVAAGAGCNLALACDLVVAAESAVFYQAFVKIGLVPDAGGSYFLPRLVGPRKAMEMVLLGEKIGAADALRLGLINKTAPDEDLVSEVGYLAARLSSGPCCQGMIKTMINRSQEMDLGACLEMEADYQGMAAATKDSTEGVIAFIQKRKPEFKGN